MTLYSHLHPKDARFIIARANEGLSFYKIAKLTGLNKDKIRRNLIKCRIETRKANLSQPWKGPHVKIRYSFKKWLIERDLAKSQRAYMYAKRAQEAYKEFVDFCENLYENEKFLGKKVKRSADEFIKEFKKQKVAAPCPSRDWVYKMAKSDNYEFNHKWLPHTKRKRFTLKSEHEQLKAIKYNSIDDRPDKELLRSFEGNFEIDSFIGKRTDKQALLTLMDIHTGDFYSRFYNRTMQGFKDALSELIVKHDLKINTLTMDNGGENNMIWKVVDKSKLFNCYAYCSGQKGTLENKHRILRRIFKKSESLNNYTNNDLVIANKFVNNYYSKTFNRI